MRKCILSLPLTYIFQKLVDMVYILSGIVYVMYCAIWYHLYNLKYVKNTHGGVLLLVKLGSKKQKP